MLSRPRRPRRLTAAALVAMAPVAVALAAPASAAGVEVTPAPEGCGVVVAVTGLAEGTSTAVVRATLVGSGEPVPVVPETGASPAPEPALIAVRTLTGDGKVVVLLDADAVPDADPRVAVEVTVDGEAAPEAELVLPGCGAPPTPSPTTSPTAVPTTTPTSPPTAAPTSEPTAVPTSAPTDDPAPTTGPTEESTTPPTVAPVAPSSPVASPSVPPSASPPAAPSPSTSPAASPQPTTTSSPVPSSRPSPVLTAAPVPSPRPVLSDTLDLAYGASPGGSGTSGYLSLMSFAAAPQLDVAPDLAAVPAPVIAAPEGSAAGVLAAPEGARTPLEDLLPQRPEADGDEPVTAQLAAPDLATDAAADPLVDLAPAAFVLSASLGGLLMAGRRRTS